MLKHADNTTYINYLVDDNPFFFLSLVKSLSSSYYLKMFRNDLNQNIIDVNDDEDEFFDSLLNIFSSKDALLRDINVRPCEKVKELYLLIGESIEDQKNVQNSSLKVVQGLKQIEKKYLNNIFVDFLNMAPELRSQVMLDLNTCKVFLINKLGYFDSKDFLYKHKNTDVNPGNCFSVDELSNICFNDFYSYDGNFKYSFFEEEDMSIDLKREVIIKELFRGDLDEYLLKFKEKTHFIAQELFKWFLYTNSQDLSNEQLEKLILYLDYYSDSLEDKNDLSIDEAVTMLALNQPFLNILYDPQKDFCKALFLISEQLKTHGVSSTLDDDKNLLYFYAWLKKDPQANLRVIRKAMDLINKQRIFANETPNILMVYLNRIEQSLRDGIFINSLINVFPLEILKTVPVETADQLENLCEKSLASSFELINELTRQEEQIVKSIKNKKLKMVLHRNLKKVLFGALFVLIPLLISQLYKFYFDIEGIYKNNLYSSAKYTIEAIPYPSEIKDSLNPTINEIRQKERMDSIKDLNVRYFKLLTLFLSPDLSDKSLEKSFKTLPLNKEIKNIEKIKIIRENLKGLISPDEWKNEYQYLFGQNILEELRAYGAVANFLTPSLSYSIEKDLSGYPLLKNGMLNLRVPQLESTVLRRELLKRNIKELREEAVQPKIFIDKYDDNYKIIREGFNELQNRIHVKKESLIKIYRTSNSKQDKEKIRLALQVVALLDFIVDDLQKKIKIRHDFIISKNTYRALLER